MNNYPNYNQTATENTNNNLNFNKCLYVQTNPNNLYDSYAGFIRGNMFPDLYNTYKLSKPYDIQPMNEQAELLTYIDALSFATTDLNLYLDNFPNNQEMLGLFNQYNIELEKMTKEYERKYGPLFANSTTNNDVWAWDSCPWPWENK